MEGFAVLLYPRIGRILCEIRRRVAPLLLAGLGIQVFFNVFLSSVFWF